MTLHTNVMSARDLLPGTASSIALFTMQNAIPTIPIQRIWFLLIGCTLCVLVWTSDDSIPIGFISHQVILNIAWCFIALRTHPNAGSLHLGLSCCYAPWCWLLRHYSRHSVNACLVFWFHSESGEGSVYLGSITTKWTSFFVIFAPSEQNSDAKLKNSSESISKQSSTFRKEPDLSRSFACSIDVACAVLISSPLAKKNHIRRKGYTNLIIHNNYDK